MIFTEVLLRGGETLRKGFEMICTDIGLMSYILRKDNVMDR